MGTGLFNSPPGDGAPPVDVPVIDFVASGKAKAVGAKQSGWIEHFWAVFWAAAMDGITGAFGLIAGGMNDIMAVYLRMLEAFMGTDQPGFFQLLAQVISGLLGVEINADAMRSAFKGSGRVAALRTAGGAIFDTLAAEFAPAAGSVTVTPSADPAKAFLGFLAEFAIREGNIAFWSTMIPEEYRIFEGIREYGEMLAKNLGLGRLARLALRPLITTLVADPLQWHLNELYRPKLLSEHDALKAFTEGQMNAGDLSSILIKWGYDPKLHQILTSNTYKKPSIEELYLYHQSLDGDVNPDQAALQLLGYAPSDARLAWSAARQAHINPLVHAYLNEVRAQFKEGLIDVSQRDAIIAEMPLSNDERTWWIRIMANAPVAHVRHLSEGEIERAYLEGILDLSTVQNTWQRYGYTADAVQTLTFLLLAKQAGTSKTSAGHKPVKHLTEAELEKAFHGGLLTLAQVQAYWALLGYSAADVTTLTGLIQLPPKAPAAGAIAPAPAP